MSYLMKCFPVCLLLAALLLAVSPALADQSHPTIDEADGWKPLFDGKDLTGWEGSKKWTVDADGVLSRGRGDIWTAEKFGDFVLDLEFKVARKTNSGVVVRVDPKVRPWWKYGCLEIQILDSSHKKKPGKHDGGSLYDLLAPSANAMKKPGEWNRYTITAKDNKLTVVLNGQQIIDMNLDDWTEARRNPDGSKNKYRGAIKDMPREGHILLQDHGNPVWFRNINIKPL